VDAFDVDDWIVLQVYIDSMKMSQDREKMHRQLRQLQQVHQLAAGLESGRADPAKSTSPLERLSTIVADMGTQTDLIVVDRLNPIVNFLDSSKCTLEPSSIPHCFQYRPDHHFLKSPKISVIIQGVRVPIIIDTGAEISILSSEFVASLFADDDLSTNTRAVRNLGGGLVSVYGPIELTVIVCGLTLEHPFFYYEDNPTFLMGIDLLTRAALTIDCESRCVRSKHTLRCHV